jgi:hypothetical protein
MTFSSLKTWNAFTDVDHPKVKAKKAAPPFQLLSFAQAEANPDAAVVSFIALPLPLPLPSPMTSPRLDACKYFLLRRKLLPSSVPPNNAGFVSSISNTQHVVVVLYHPQHTASGHVHVPGS